MADDLDTTVHLDGGATRQPGELDMQEIPGLTPRNDAEPGAGTDAVEVGGQHEPAARHADAESDATKELKRQLDAANANTARLQRERDEAAKQARDAGTGQLINNYRALEATITAEQQRVENARSARRAAREAGDFDAEQKAEDILHDASFNLRVASGNKTAFEQRYGKPGDGVPRQQQQTETRQGNGPTTEAQRWIDTHPRFNSDPEYKADALASHQLAMDNGRAEGSQAYIDFIDQRMARLYGANHGRGDNTTARGAQPRSRSDASTAAPRSGAGGNDLSTGDGKMRFTHAQGTLELRQIPDAKSPTGFKETVVGKIPAAWVEYAGIAGFMKGKTAQEKQEGLIKYAVEQMHIQREQREGSLKGLATGQNGVYQ